MNIYTKNFLNLEIHKQLCKELTRFEFIKEQLNFWFDTWMPVYTLFKHACKYICDSQYKALASIESDIIFVNYMYTDSYLR